MNSLTTTLPLRDIKREANGMKTALERTVGSPWSDKSPWERNSPIFKAIPEEKPKTKQPVTLFLCSTCGSAVANRKLHSQWHQNPAHKQPQPPGPPF